MIIHNCRIVTWEENNQLLTGYAVRIVDDHIVTIQREQELLDQYPSEDTLDAHGQLLMPGLICAHTHFYGAFSRGMSLLGEAPAAFPEILTHLWWPLDRSLDEESVYYSTLVCLIDAIKHGTTTVFDHHASPMFISGSLDTIAKGLREVGIRGSVCYEVTDRGGHDKALEGIEENLRMIRKYQANPLDSMVIPTFGLHASLTLSNETLKLCRDGIPSGFGFHVHIAEHQSDQFDSLRKSGLHVVQHLEHFGMTGKDSIFVHGVHIDAKEQQIIADSHTWLTHQPRSNMNNAVGMAAVESFLNMGIPVCIGNDGFSFAMWDEWRACYLAHKLWHHDPRSMNGALVTEMGARNNAAMASHFFKNKIGEISPGAKADLILVDYTPFTEMTTGNLPWHILFGFRDSMVTMTMVNGKILMKDRTLLFLDEAKISGEALRISKEVWARYQHQTIG